MSLGYKIAWICHPFLPWHALWERVILSSMRPGISFSLRFYIISNMYFSGNYMLNLKTDKWIINNLMKGMQRAFDICDTRKNDHVGSLRAWKRRHFQLLPSKWQCYKKSTIQYLIKLSFFFFFLLPSTCMFLWKRIQKFLVIPGSSR